MFSEFIIELGVQSQLWKSPRAKQADNLDHFTPDLADIFCTYIVNFCRGEDFGDILHPIWLRSGPLEINPNLNFTSLI